MNAIKRFGSAMIVPVLMFAFFGIVLGFATSVHNLTPKSFYVVLKYIVHIKAFS
jgi:hypothetical protein